MLCARATLYAGSLHSRYRRGTAVRAVVFATVDSPDELKLASLKSLKHKGWAKMTIDGYASLADDHALATGYSAEAKAFQAAQVAGIGIVVLGMVQ